MACETDAGIMIRKPGTSEPEFKKGKTIPYLAFTNIEKTGVVKQLFSTRRGGVSGRTEGKEYLTSLNLSFNRGDAEADVNENFRRVAEELGIDKSRFVFTDQTHTANVRIVTEEDAGKGLVRPRDYSDVDGLVTDVPELVLSVFTADCVPVAIVDPEKKAIGLVHSGWRGTVRRIGGKAVGIMAEQYGSRPEDLICAVGPSICRDCYEVSEDVAESFAREFPGYAGEILTPGRPGHYQLDLWAANRAVLEEAGVPERNIQTTGVCTCCNSNVLFSHRASHGKRGNLGAFLMLKKN